MDQEEKQKQVESDNEKIEDELRAEIRHYLDEKEKIRKIVGQIGGRSRKGEKIINHVFVVTVLLAFLIALFFKEWRMLTIEIAVLLVSMKLIYLVSQEAKVNHFQFWMLSSIEWRLNDIGKRVRDIESKIGKDANQ